MARKLSEIVVVMRRLALDGSTPALNRQRPNPPLSAEGPDQSPNLPAVSEESEHAGIRTRGEEAIGDLAQALLENPVFNQAVSTALGAGERAVQAQRSAMGALNIASSADLERLARRLRSISDRLESIEDRIDELTDDVAALRSQHIAAR
jgi:chromosome segregation ATPase